MKIPASSSIGNERRIFPRTKHEGLSGAGVALLTYKKNKKTKKKKIRNKSAWGIWAWLLVAQLQKTL